MPRWVSYVQLSGPFATRDELIADLRTLVGEDAIFDTTTIIAEDLDVQKLEHVVVALESTPVNDDGPESASREAKETEPPC